MNLPKVGIVYVPFENHRHLPTIIDSWSKLNYPKENLHLYIITNSNPENCLELLQDDLLPKFSSQLPEYTIIADGENKGFSDNHNKGIIQAIEDKCDYVFLNNGDLYLHPDCIDELIKVAESDESIATVQSLCLYWNDHNMINVAGGAIHLAGHGYALGNLSHINQAPKEITEITYSSLASTLIKTSILKEIGLLEDGFFMYHEDLELGLRTRIAGFKNVIAPKSISYHDYDFFRTPEKFTWMEINRYIIVLSYYKLPTLILILPILIGVEIASWAFALKGGWIGARFGVIKAFLQPKTWLLIIKIRARMHRLRRISDRVLLQNITGEIHGQETDNIIVQKIANPLLSLYLKFLQFIVIW